jgi:hypothetical protein
LRCGNKLGYAPRKSQRRLRSLLAVPLLSFPEGKTLSLEKTNGTRDSRTGFLGAMQSKGTG